MVLLWIVLLFSSAICQANWNGLTERKSQAAFVGDRLLAEEEIVAEIVLGRVADQDQEVDEFFLVDEVEEIFFGETKVEEISPGKELDTIVFREDEIALLRYSCTWGLILLALVLMKKIVLRMRARTSKPHKLPVDSCKPPVDAAVIESFGEIIAEALHKKETGKLSEEAVRGLSKEKLGEVMGRRKAERIANRFSRAYIANFC